MKESDLDTHVTILGWLHIAFHALGALVGIGVLLLLVGIGVATGEGEAMAILSVVGLFVGALLTILSLPGILAGVGLLRRKNWGRVLAIIVSILGLMNFPLGTIVGIYALYVLLQADAGPYFTEPKLA